MYACANCKQKEGIEKCKVCGTLFCFFCDEENNKPHDPEEHGPIYDYNDWLEAMRERSMELRADAVGDYRGKYL